jgi:hypothetical protein
MENDRKSLARIDWAAMPSSFRERVLFLFATGILFAAYLASTIWKVTAVSISSPGATTIFTGDVMSFDFLLLGVSSFFAVSLIAATISTIASSHSACASNGDVLHFTAELGLRLKLSAASRRDAPASTASITRSRKSSQYGFGIGRLSQKTNRCSQIRPPIRPLGIPTIQPSRNML